MVFDPLIHPLVTRQERKKKKKKKLNGGEISFPPLLIQWFLLLAYVDNKYKLNKPDIKSPIYGKYI